MNLLEFLNKPNPILVTIIFLIICVILYYMPHVTGPIQTSLSKET